MSINTSRLIDMIRGKDYDLDPVIEFHETQVDLEGIERDIEVEVTIGHHSDTVYVTHEMDGEEDLTVSLPVSHVVRSVADEDSTMEVLGGLLETLAEEEYIQVVHAIASARLADCDSQEERKWERVHTAVTRVEPEPEPEPVEPDEKVIRTIEVEVPVTEEALAHATGGRTQHTLGCLTRGTRFWITSQSLHALHYDERVPATTWGENMTDDTEVWILELAPALDPAATEDTVVTPDDLSSARSLAMAMIRNDHQRPLLIGLLVESGYAVGKKVS